MRDWRIPFKNCHDCAEYDCCEPTRICNICVCFDCSHDRDKCLNMEWCPKYEKSIEVETVRR
jgi:hypothetical protein